MYPSSSTLEASNRPTSLDLTRIPFPESLTEHSTEPESSFGPSKTPGIPMHTDMPLFSTHHSQLPQLSMLSTSDSATVAAKTTLITPPPTPPEHPWQEISARKRRVRESILSEYSEWRLDVLPDSSVKDVSELVLQKLDERERAIVHLDATAITTAIRERAYTAEEVLISFIKVTVAAQDTINCITEIFFEEGLARARELDQHLVETGEVVGPLHGLPVSIKDHILIKGHDTSTGYVAWADETRAEKDAVVVDVLRQAGAVLFVKTANPQTLLSLETDNNIYGRTCNPFNRRLSPGGSSGGESALISARGSPMGVGTDIGGSIRIPAAYTGCYGFKPSVARMPHAGLMGSHDGMDNIVGVVGPITRSARDLELFCKTMLQYQAWLLEHAVLEIPWQSNVCIPQRLCFAILWDDGVVKPHPPLTRELTRVKNALLAAGHEVIEWEPLDHQAGWDLIVKLYLLDAGQEYHETMAISGEPPTPSAQWIMAHAANRAPYTVPETWKLNGQREAFKAKALQHWNATRSRTSTGRPVDAIICPTAPTLAVPHDATRWWGYTSHWNMLDLPGVVFPSGGRLKVSEFQEKPNVVPRNDIEKDVWSMWNPSTFEGAPISLQLVGRRHNEEKVLAMLNVVEDAMSKAK